MPKSEVSIQYGGGTYGGSYRQTGKAVFVTSPYGAANAQVGILETGPLAELLLFGLVQTWNRRNRHVAEVRSA